MDLTSSSIAPRRPIWVGIFFNWHIVVKQYIDLYLKAMNSTQLDCYIKSYPDFPKKGILFKDIFPILSEPEIFSSLVNEMAKLKITEDAEAILAIDSRGFLFGAGIAILSSKPLVVARKPGKLPGELIEKSYQLEYGKNSLSIQKDALEKFQSYVIVDDLLATGGTVDCVAGMLKEFEKEITGLNVVVELKDLYGRKRLPFKVKSQIQYWFTKYRGIN